MNIFDWQFNEITDTNRNLAGFKNEAIKRSKLGFKD